MLPRPSEAPRDRGPDAPTVTRPHTQSVFGFFRSLSHFPDSTQILPGVTLGAHCRLGDLPQGAQPSNPAPDDRVVSVPRATWLWVCQVWPWGGGVFPSALGFCGEWGSR